MNVDYFCPNCQTKLVRGKDKRYETLGEHVSCHENDNLRPTYECPDRRCWFHNAHMFWDCYGNGGYGLEHHMYNDIQGCYSGFYYEAIIREWQHERPHPPPKKPLMVDNFCKLGAPCPYGNQCCKKSLEQPIGFHMIYDASELRSKPLIINDRDVSGEFKNVYQCDFYNKEYVQNYFAKFKDIQHHDKETWLKESPV